MRIVSLLPSATEILFAVGAGDDVLGVTFECDFPEEARLRTVVSTTALPADLTPSEIDAVVRARMAAGEDLYTLDEGALAVLDPDLIVTQDLCAVCAVAVDEVDAALDHLGCRADVVTLDPMTLGEVLDSIGTVGGATGHTGAAQQLLSELRDRLDAVAAAVAGRARPSVGMLEWTDPPFGAG
ncbi:MAG TPA: ABC transporter substrate-binding protein, partial [Acidimicrobiales bacterium]|nr:ABC transporter substrate-binding protein [Acidimicrobiales bacterium]